MFRTASKLALLASLAAFGLVACGDDNKTNGPGNTVGLDVAVPTTTSAANLTITPGADGLTLTEGTHTLVLTQVEVLLENIEIERAGRNKGCDDDDDDGCADIDRGPLLLNLPLDGTVERSVTVNLPIGTYDKIEFEIDDLDDDSRSELATTRPEFRDVSIIANGTYDGAAFVFSSRVEAEQEIRLPTPIVVTETSSDVAVTVSIDVGRWFVDNAGTVVNPSDAALKRAINDRIERSFEAFGNDDDHDDDDDDHDD